MKQNTTDRFLIGSWVSFYSFDIHSYEYQLDQMHNAGLNFNIYPAVFGGGIQTPGIWEEVERQYAKRDMFYLLYGGLEENTRALNVSYAAGKDRCIGYHLMDEPCGTELPAVGQTIRAFRAADPKRYPFVNLFPSYAGEQRLGGDYYSYCSRFIREAGAENIEYLSHDFYPFHTRRTNLRLFADMEIIRRTALENGKLRTHAFSQASAWHNIRMPNIDEMRWNVYAYLAYGFKALSWFNLVCPGNSDTEGEGFCDSLIYRDGTIRNPALFRDFAALNREILALGDTLMQLDTLRAYHTLRNVDGVEFLPDTAPIRPTEDGDFVISDMITKDEKSRFVMIFNKSWEKPSSASFTVSSDSGIAGLAYISPWDGREYPAAMQNGTFSAAFRPGEGKLYRLLYT